MSNFRETKIMIETLKTKNACLESRVLDLLDEQEKFQELVDTIDEVVFLLALDPPRIVYVNPAFEKIWGLPRQALYKRVDAWLDTIVPEDRPIAFDAFERANVDSSLSFEYRIKRPDGSVRWIHARLWSVQCESGDHRRMVGIAEDVTGKKEAERSLMDSEERFREIAETITEVFWIYGPDLSKIHYISPSYEEVWGRSREELYANSTAFVESIHPDDRECALAALAHLDRFDHEYRIIMPDGSIRWIHDRGFPVKDASGKVVRVIGLARDVTRQKLAEAAIREREERWNAFFSSSSVGMAIVDREFRYVRINEPLARTNGLTIAQHEGRTLKEVVPDIAPTIEPVMQRVFDTGEPVMDLLLHGTTARQPKTAHSWSVSYFPIRNARAEIYAVGTVIVDVTHQCQLESQLRQAQKM
ncbi:MAG: PAS domain-containing protein, partial [Elusimicrobia bacterium]|nr:PAS domain-containing protein [Elusimicrobiota bacterium]